MNKSRIIGALVLIIGLAINGLFNNWIIASISGAMIVFGIYFIVSGKPLFQREK